MTFKAITGLLLASVVVVVGACSSQSTTSETSSTGSETVNSEGPQSGRAEASLIAQDEWDRTVREIGSDAAVCDAWRVNDLSESVLLSAAAPAISRAGYEPDDALVQEFLTAYRSVVAGNCGIANPVSDDASSAIAAPADGDRQVAACDEIESALDSWTAGKQAGAAAAWLSSEINDGIKATKKNRWKRVLAVAKELENYARGPYLAELPVPELSADATNQCKDDTILARWVAANSLSTFVDALRNYINSEVDNYTGFLYGSFVWIYERNGGIDRSIDANMEEVVLFALPEYLKRTELVYNAYERVWPN
jgi:hypothetical protein